MNEVWFSCGLSGTMRDGFVKVVMLPEAIMISWMGWENGPSYTDDLKTSEDIRRPNSW